MARLVIAVLLTLIACAWCSRDRANIDARVQYWKATLQPKPCWSDSRGPGGAGSAPGIKFDYLPHQIELYANMVPESGPKFPCSEWNIIVAINLDSDSHAVGRNVRPVGTY
jgi:hypothetical protein